jgi:hypothetical protein
MRPGKGARRMAWYASLLGLGLLMSELALAELAPDAVVVVCSCKATPNAGACSAAVGDQGGSGCCGCGANQNQCVTCDPGYTCQATNGTAQNGNKGTAECIEN